MGRETGLKYRDLHLVRRKRWKENFDTLTLHQRIGLIPANAPASEFEVQSYLYSSLLALGWKVRGELKTRCRSCRFDLVVFDDQNKPVRIIEVKRRKSRINAAKRGDRRQAARYREFGIPVDLVRGMEEAERYIEVVRSGSLPKPQSVPDIVPATAVSDDSEPVSDVKQVGRLILPTPCQPAVAASASTVESNRGSEPPPTIVPQSSRQQRTRMKPMFKSHNTLGMPLCPCCGGNPRQIGRVKCARCQREQRAIQWDRLTDDTKEEVRTLMQAESLRGGY